MFERTVNINIGRKFIGTSRDDMLAEVLKLFRIIKIQAVQQSYDIVKVTFDSKEEAMHVLRETKCQTFWTTLPNQWGPPGHNNTSLRLSLGHQKFLLGLRNCEICKTSEVFFAGGHLFRHTFNSRCAAYTSSLYRQYYWLYLQNLV